MAVRSIGFYKLSRSIVFVISAARIAMISELQESSVFGAFANFYGSDSPLFVRRDKEIIPFNRNYICYLENALHGALSLKRVKYNACACVYNITIKRYI